MTQLSWQDHRQYIVQTILNKGDEEAVAWLFQKLSREQVKQMLPKLKLDAKSANFWRIYLA